MKRGVVPWAIIVFLAILFPGLARGGQADKWEEVFFRANQSYKEGDFEGAVKGYLDLIRSGHGGGQVHYNLGNAYLRAGELGKAILEYERAILFMPRDPDLNFNLTYARGQTRDAVEETRGIVETAFFWVNAFNLHELFWTFAILNMALWSVLLIRLFRATEWVYYLLLAVLFLWIIAGLSFGLKYYWIKTDDRAVILEKEVKILAGPEEKDTVLFKLHEGTVVHEDRSEDGWSLVRLPDSKRGWVKSKAIGLISGDGAVP